MTEVNMARLAAPIYEGSPVTMKWDPQCLHDFVEILNRNDIRDLKGRRMTVGIYYWPDGEASFTSTLEWEDE